MKKTTQNRNKLFLLGMFGMVLAFGVVLSGCVSLLFPKSLTGTWKASSGGQSTTLIFSGKNIVVEVSGYGASQDGTKKGTFTFKSQAAGSVTMGTLSVNFENGTSVCCEFSLRKNSRCWLWRGVHAALAGCTCRHTVCKYSAAPRSICKIGKIRTKNSGTHFTI
ncbi:MAG: hypothetical protein Ta2A_18600 [Treponemataceae bacterium]|nr:MAG: hypothetical protein Ta2A_18600 [Treponemataceae bacterium]